VIDRLRGEPSGAPPLPDVNRMSSRAGPDVGIRGSGARINRVVRGSNAEQIGLRSGDVVLTINSQPLAGDVDVGEALRSFPPGRPLIITVARPGETVKLTGRYAPTVLPGESEAIFPAQRESGRVDLMRAGNRIDAKTRGVAAFTLLLSPAQFDFDRAVTVAVNGRTVFEGKVRKDVRTLLEWAARDNDRTMLFAAQLPIVVPP
jgi:membrane-associated protease RseP (regulator of RpoE activity)